MQLKNKLLTMAILSTLSVQTMAAETTQAASLGEALTEGKVSGMIRLRYEYVDQDSKDVDATALTYRALIGYETKPLNGFSVNTQVYGVGAPIDDYNDRNKNTTDPDKAKYPVIADPEDIDFHQAYIQWANKSNKVKIGRQNMFLDNWRFIGDVRFRQNWAVFNGISYVNTSLPKTTVTLAHFTKLKTVTTKLVDIETSIANVGYQVTPTTKATGYAYLHENKDAAATSIQTYGFRLDGKEKINDKFSALFTGEYAVQDDYADADDIDNDYYFVSAGLGFGGWGFRINQEMLSAADNGSTRGFQTPLGTNHLFTGWADLFLSTPNATGIKDTFVTAVGMFKGAKIKAAYHMIDADESNASGDDEYGTEFDLGVYYKFKKNVIGSFEYANFKQEDKSLGKGDIEKFWVTGIYKF
jgi:hypothetical protein